MHTILEGIEGVTCYIDDVLIWGDTLEQHDLRLRQVLDRCRQERLCLNASKCQFRVSQVKYFGHSITAAGLHPDRGKIHALLAMKAPNSRDELRRFSGMVQY